MQRSTIGFIGEEIPSLRHGQNLVVSHFLLCLTVLSKPEHIPIDRIYVPVKQRKTQRMTKSHVALKRPPFDCVALVLQGGGALGAYQGGVYQALAEAKIELDWIAGISIGAINAALIAGNPPEARVDKLRAFWEGITSPNNVGVLNLWESYWRGDQARSFFNQLQAVGALIQGTPGFFQPRVPPPFFFPAGAIEATSYYDTSQLRGTLERLVDFDYLNAGKMRFSVGAVNVRSGNFVYFDSTIRTIKVEHIMASGALPPRFPAVEVDGELYWDGGLISNTPLDWVTSGGETDQRQDTLTFQVDLWSSRGEAPADIMEVMMREMEIQHSSRTRLNTDTFKQLQTVRRTVADALEKIPAEWLDRITGQRSDAMSEPGNPLVFILFNRQGPEDVQVYPE
jgi:NTE family protein